MQRRYRHQYTTALEISFKKLEERKINLQINFIKE
jgi:hypothetical protein